MNNVKGIANPLAVLKPTLDDDGIRKLAKYLTQIQESVIKTSDDINPISAGLDPTSDNSPISYILIMCACLHLRISDLEATREAENGSVNYTEDPSMTPYLGSVVYNNLSTLSTTNQRLNAIEKRLSYLQATTADSIANLITAVNSNASDVYNNGLVPTVTMLNIENGQIALNAIEPRSGTDNTVTTYIGYAKTATNVIGTTSEFLATLSGFPEAVPTIEAVKSALSGMFSVAEKAYGAYTTYKMIDSNDKRSTLSKIWAALAGDASTIRPALKTSNLVSTLSMVNLLYQVNATKAVTDTGIAETPSTLEIYLRPIDGGVAKFLGEKVISWASVHQELDLNAWANRLPVHASVSINIMTSSTTRVQFLVSVGAVNINIQLIATLFTSNFFEYVERTQTLVSGVWTTQNVIYQTPNLDLSFITDDVKNGTLYKVHSIPSNQTLVESFLSLMKEFTPPYSILNHNCQHMVSEIASFLVNGTLPGWWKPEYSRSTLLSQVLALSPSNPLGLEFEKPHHDRLGLTTDIYDSELYVHYSLTEKVRHLPFGYLHKHTNCFANLQYNGKAQIVDMYTQYINLMVMSIGSWTSQLS